MSPQRDFLSALNLPTAYDVPGIGTLFPAHADGLKENLDPLPVIQPADQPDQGRFSRQPQFRPYPVSAVAGVELVQVNPVPHDPQARWVLPRFTSEHLCGGGADRNDP